jgi:hypothetical protein
MAKKNKHHLPAITRVVIQGGQLIPNVARAAAGLTSSWRWRS